MGLDNCVSHCVDEWRRSGVQQDPPNLHEHRGQSGEKVRHVFARRGSGREVEEEDLGLGGQERGSQAAGQTLQVLCKYSRLEA